MASKAMERNFNWFVDNYDEIYKLCGECHVLIKDQKIIKIFDDIKDGLKYMEDHDLFGISNLQYCNGDISGYTEYEF